MNQRAEDLKKRTAAFAKLIIELCKKVPATDAGRTMSKQLIEAATSVAANYRATCRARSHAEFVAKIGTVEEEADECVGWLELLVSTDTLKPAETEAALAEAGELTAIFTASHRTARGRRGERSGKSPTPESAVPKSPIPAKSPIPE